MDHLNDNFLVGKLGKTLFYSLNRSLYIGLDDDRKLLKIAGLDLVKQVIQRKLAFGLLEKTALVLCNECACKVLGFFIALKGHQDLTCIRNITKSEDLNRSRRTCLFYTTSFIIHHCTYLTVACTCSNKISHMKSTLLNKNSSNRSFTLIKLSLNNKTSCLTVRIGFELGNLSSKKDHLKKILNSFSCMCGHRNKDGASAPVLRNQFILGKFLFYTLNICTWFIDLIDGNDDLNTCCLCMTDRLYCLRHYTIVCGNDQNCDICSVGTTHTHSCERLMSRCIQECDLLALDIYHVSTDVLCDSAGLASGYVCITDSIQKRCFTMVNVTHNTDYRRSRNHIILVLFVLFEELCDHIHLFFLLSNDIKAKCDLLCLFKVDLLVYCYHDTFHEKLLNDH